jgi:FkbM family methyltransferase
MSTSAATSAGKPPVYRSAGLQCRVARWLWRRGSTRRRKKLRRWVEAWLERHAPVVIPLDGSRIVLDGPGTLSRSLFLMGGRELEDEAAFRRLVRPGMTVFDVGANLGIYTLLAARRAGPGGQVHAWEPVPDLFDLLAQSVRLSRFRNVSLNRAAVSDRGGSMPMFLAEGTKSDIHALAPSAERSRQIEVPVMALDEYAAERGIERVDLLKLDIEGAELLALRGAEGLLRSARPPLLQVELADNTAADFGIACADVKQFLAGHGYTGYRRGADGRWQVVTVAESHPKWENVLFLQPRHRELAPPEWRLPEAAA